jgi:hypothetical protein
VPAQAEPTLVEPPQDTVAHDQRTAATAASPPRATTDLTLEVLDAVTGRPVPAFFATVLPAGLHAQGRDGVARFPELWPGTLTMQVQGPEHEAAVASAELPAAEPVVVRLTQRTGMRGVVRFADARPAPDVTLRLEVAAAAASGAPRGFGTPSPAPREEAHATLAKTDADGRYRFAPVPSGRYAITLEHLGHTLPPLGPYEVTSGMTDVPEVRLDAGARLEIEVTDSGGLPGANVLIVVVPATGSALRRYSASDGKLILEPLVPGRYIVTLPAQGGQAEQRRELELTIGLHRESFRVDSATPTRR